MKQCSRCKKWGKVDNFFKDKYTKDGLDSWCKSCRNKSNFEYYQKNKSKILEYAKDYREINKEKVNKREKLQHLKCPWKRLLVSINQRCNNIKCKDYKYYGGRGIKCLITEKELKKLWFRDKAWLLKHPSIDREDNDGHYTYNNCQFIELKENAAKDKRKIIYQFDLNGSFIKEWTGIKIASKKLNISRVVISRCVNNKPHAITAGGFKWKKK